MVGDEPWLPPLSWLGDGISLRLYSPSDAAALQVATLESYEHLKPWMPWAKEEQSLAETEAICRRLASEYLANTNFTVGAWDGDELIGGTGFHLRCGPVEWRCSEIGMWIRASRAGQGWGTRILDQMLDWGFSEWGWERLVWKCDSDNVASARVAEKCGLRREADHPSSAVNTSGIRTGTYVYAILKHEWLALREA